MSYLDDVEKELRELIEGLPAGTGNDSDAYDHALEYDYEEQMAKIIAYVKSKVLESFKNGAQAARNKSKNRNRNYKQKAETK